jgi:SAM-dependent methyltransferase
MTDPTQRFSGRVENYARYRPSYPRAVLNLLETRCGLTSTSVVADVGSGTGILSGLFLENGNRVFGVEPNKEMREAGEERLERYPRFVSVAGTAEAGLLTQEERQAAELERLAAELAARQRCIDELEAKFAARQRRIDELETTLQPQLQK